jgi:hypothetical protein
MGAQKRMLAEVSEKLADKLMEIHNLEFEDDDAFYDFLDKVDDFLFSSAYSSDEYRNINFLAKEYSLKKE